MLNSRLATLLAAPLTACSDPMAGFFAVDRRAFPDRMALRPVGYKIGLELMVRGRLRVGEVPIAFDDRRRGKSKLGWRRRLRLPAPPQPVLRARLRRWVDARVRAAAMTARRRELDNGAPQRRPRRAGAAIVPRASDSGHRR